MNNWSLAKRREIETKRQYGFEINAPILEPYRKQLSLSKLIDFAGTFWDHEGRNFTYFPKLRFGKGLKGKKSYFSYADTENSCIELVDGERDRITVLHEMLHIAGFPYHDRMFYSAQIKYLYLFCEFDLKKLIKSGREFNLEYKF